jgi:hypothetical protein
MLRELFRRLNRAVGRFNDWIGPSAVAAGAQEGEYAPTVDAASVAVLLDEVDKNVHDRE